MKKILSIAALAALVLMSGIGIAQAQWGCGGYGRQSGGGNGQWYGQNCYTGRQYQSNSGSYGNNQWSGRNTGYSGNQSNGWSRGGYQGGGWNGGNRGGGSR